MNDCSIYRDDLSAYIDGELTWDEREAIEKHMAACPACADEVEVLRHTQKLCQQLEDVNPPSDLTSSIMDRVRDERDEQLKRRWRRFYPWGAVAAVLLIFMVAVQVTPVPGWQQLTQALPGVGSNLDTRMWDQANFITAPAPGDVVSDSAVDAPDHAPEAPDGGMAISGLEAMPQDMERMIVKTGRIVAEVAEGELDEIETHIINLVEQREGYVESSSQMTEPSGRRRTNMVVRVPAEEFSNVLYGFDDQLSRVLERSAAAEDVSETYMDLRARLRNREVQERRLLEIMDMAASVDEIMQVENELARVRSDIEYLMARMRYYESVVSLSTIQMQLREAASPIGELASWWEDVRDAFMSSIRGLAVYTAWLLPYAGFILLLWILVKRIRFKRTSGSKRQE